LGGTIIELGASPGGAIERELSLSNSAAPVDLSGPHVVVGDANFDFGSMERGVSKSHSFELKNAGGKPLSLEKGSVSCGLCIIGVQFSESPVPPGESAEATITWKANSMGPFRHSADVLTNDPSRPQIQFVITGKVMNSFRVSPEQVVFTNASAGGGATAELRIYAYRTNEIKVTGHKFRHEEQQDKFDVRVEPLTDEQLHEDPDDAKSGVAVFVSTKPGLPVGPLTQHLELTLDLPENPVVDVPIGGSIVSDVQVIGTSSGWDADTGVLSLGTISRREGAKVQLVLQAHGPHAKDLQPKLHAAKPEELKVSFGLRQEIAGGRVVKVPLIVEVPAGSKPSVHLGNKQGEMGEIVIDTGHPEASTLRLPVRFTVAGD
jgi:hypothetical protein